MDLRFMGDLPWWQGLAIAIAAASVAWWLYRRETTSQSRRTLKWLLPTLRAITVFLVVMILTGPVLHHRKVIGQLGRVMVFLDASQSMSIVDPETSAGRKLLVAQSRGWLPDGTIDPTLRETADALAQSVRQSAEGQRPGSSIDTLRATIKQFADQVAAVHTQLTAIPAERIPAPPLRSGSVLREYWTGINGGSLNELRELFNSGKPATGHDFLNRFESPANWSDNHAQRISGFVYPPATGAYQFWIACDDAAALYLSSDDNPANKQRVAVLENFTTRGQWPEGSARSAPITLETGRTYYIEAEHKEGGGEDFVAVGWTLPDGTQERPIPGHRLATPNPEGGSSHFAGMVARFGQDVARTARALADETLNADNQIQIRDRLVAVTAQATSYELRIREAFEAYAGALAASGDPAVAAALDKYNSLSRWKRAEGMLLDEKNGLLDQLVGQHEVELVALGATGETLWTHTDTQRLPRLPVEASSPITNLADGVRSRLERTDTSAETNPDDKTADDSETPAQRSAVVLISDGQHNEGPSPTEMARLLRTRRVPVYTVTLGSEQPPHDMAILDINHPDIVFHEDRVRGMIDLKDHMPARKPFTIKIEHEGELLWSKKLVTQGRSPRQVPFDFPIKELVDAKMAAVSDRDIKLHSIPMAFNVSVVPLEGEAREDNNTRPMHVRATTREGQMLILDGRARWETRYVRNLFERDQRWKVNTLLLPPGVAPKTGQAQGTFPQDRESLFAYDLIVFGEVHPKTLTPEQSEWIRDFVKTRGGGLIFIDGQRKALRGYEGTPIADLLPVKWVERDDTMRPESLRLTDTGANVTALSLVSGQEPNTALWRTLPAPHWIAPVIALPGTETLAEAASESHTVPLLVQRRFGAGRVWYQGFDESWRWRFEIADRFHQRYWNQAAAWVMETPYSVSDQFASIDAGATVYRPGQNAPLRIRLRDTEGRPILHATAEAVLYRDGREVAAIGLEADPNAGGVFRGMTPPLAGGRHEVGVRVTGISDDLIKARATFDVEAEDSAELSLLSADPALMRRVAESSGGVALSEDRAGQLPKLLEPLSGGRVVESETALWQSYWWFVPIVTLFTVEWVLRKRSGML